MIVFCKILTLVCSLRACHMWLTRNHMFIRKILGKFTLFIFWNFQISLVSLGRFQNFKKVNSVNLSQFSQLTWTSTKYLYKRIKLATFRKWAKDSREITGVGSTVLHIHFCSLYNKSKYQLKTQEWFDNEIAETIKTREKYFKSLKN